jgi:hypothetical protein
MEQSSRSLVCGRLGLFLCAIRDRTAPVSLLLGLRTEPGTNPLLLTGSPATVEIPPKTLTIADEMRQTICIGFWQFPRIQHTVEDRRTGGEPPPLQKFHLMKYWLAVRNTIFFAKNIALSFKVCQ